MAIIIPSKNIYDKQNPKVRDNVIERIEVSAQEVSPNNEYEVSVYNGQFLCNNEYEDTPQYLYDEQYERKDNVPQGDMYTEGYVRIFTQVTGIYFSGRVSIQRLKNNKYISEILAGYKTNEDNTIETDVKFTAHTNKKEGTVTAIYRSNTKPSPDTATFERNYPSEIKTYSLLPTKIEVENSASLYKEADDENDAHFNLGKTHTLIFNDNGTNLNRLSVIESDDGFDFDFTVLCGAKIDKLSSSGWYTGYIGEPDYEVDEEGNPIYPEIRWVGDTTYYEPDYVEITVYGNTIGIDLNDNTVYIKEKTAKKVHGIDGNELMQTSNYNSLTNKNAIETMYGNTLLEYAKGKETATIRCSIADYYENGSKVIAIDNSTNKMCFEIGDEVVPMVYGANGQDRPMSLYQDGSQKVFKVLGTNIYYDGAVWQELSLQEVAQKV